MATFIPNVKPEDFNNSPGEKEVYESLKLLGNNYTIFYSLSWISIGNDRTIGEADFVIFHNDISFIIFPTLVFIFKVQIYWFLSRLSTT